MKTLLLFIITFLFLAPLYAQIEDIYVVNAEKLNLRTKSNPSSESLGLLTKGFEVFVLDMDNDWFKIEFGEHVGWVKKDYLIPKKENFYTKLNLETGDSPECDNMNWKYDYGAKGALKITVGSGADFAVKLMEQSSNNCIRAFYIRSGESLSIKDIPQGSYYLKIANGLDFRQGIEDGNCIMVFNRNANYRLGKDILDFNISPKRIEVVDGKRYEVEDIPSYELSLEVPSRLKPIGKNLDSNKITVEQFNQ